MSEKTMADLPVVATMTFDERAAEMRAWKEGALVSCKFSELHERIEQLVGRPVWTHEMGMNWEGLVEEAGGARHATMNEIVDLIPPEKRIIVQSDGEVPA